MSRTKYTTAAKTMADLTGNPALESEVEAEFARSREFDALTNDKLRKALVDILEITDGRIDDPLDENCPDELYTIHDIAVQALSAEKQP